MALSDMAILYRAHFHAMEIQLELTKRGIPFVITSGLRFFEQAHIKDVAAFMKFVNNPYDEVAFRRMTLMVPGIGAKTADRLWFEWQASYRESGERVESFSATLLKQKVPAKAKEAWDQLAYTLDELITSEGKAKAPAAMMPSILQGVYDDVMQMKFPNYETRQQDLQQLTKYSEGFTTLDDFLTQLSLIAGQDAVDQAQPKPDDDCLCLSSVHQAKGLEWKAVFVVWLADGMFPNKRAIEADENDSEASALEEERRLFYVAVTRAEDELYLTYPRLWPGSFNGETLQHPSRFLDDIPLDMMEPWNVGGSAVGYSW